jgi:hypothetical protein
MDYDPLSVPNKSFSSAQNTRSFHAEMTPINAFAYRQEWCPKRLKKMIFSSDTCLLLSYWFVAWLIVLR